MDRWRGLLLDQAMINECGCDAGRYRSCTDEVLRRTENWIKIKGLATESVMREVATPL